jgi:general secretion pathway protein A
VYAAHFGLRDAPFRATPDPRLFYLNPGYREAYETLRYGVLERKGFIALIGEVGTGKTTLLRRLMDDLGKTVRFVFFYNTTLTFDETVEFICAELGLPVTDLSRVHKLQRLNEFLITEARKGGHVVLLIDEAQNLSPEVLENLRLISNLETATDKLLQIVLVGQPELDAKLADPALRQITQRIAVRHHLSPLHDGEVGLFIARRLQRCGRPRQDLFTTGAIRRITVYARGIPRAVNILCDAALLVAYAADAKRVTSTMIDEVAFDLRFRSRRRTAPGDALRWAPASVAAVALVVAIAALLSGLMAVFGDVPGPQEARADAEVVPAPPTGTVATAVSRRAAPQGEEIPSDARGDGQHTVVPPGTSISQLVSERYGPDSLLALDLIRELNPHITDFDRILAGERVWMPSLTSKTVARRQPDGSYHLIVASFATPEEANRLAELIRSSGFSVRVSAHDITRSWRIYRVSIERLESFDTADLVRRSVRRLT